MLLWSPRRARHVRIVRCSGPRDTYMDMRSPDSTPPPPEYTDPGATNPPFRGTPTHRITRSLRFLAGKDIETLLASGSGSSVAGRQRLRALARYSPWRRQRPLGQDVHLRVCAIAVLSVLAVLFNSVRTVLHRRNSHFPVSPACLAGKIQIDSPNLVGWIFYRQLVNFEHDFRPATLLGKPP